MQIRRQEEESDAFRTEDDHGDDDHELCDTSKFTPYADEPQIRVFLHQKGLTNKCEVVSKYGIFHLLPVKFNEQFDNSRRDLKTTWLPDKSVMYFMEHKIGGAGVVQEIAPGVVHFPPELYERFLSFRQIMTE